MRTRAFFIALLALLVVVATMSLATPAAQAQQPSQAERLSSVPEYQADQHVEHIAYNTPFYRFRVYDGGMYCQANVRMWVHNGVQVTTMKMVGSECYRQRIRVNYGSGYERPLTDFNAGNKLRVETPVSRPFFTVLYGLCVVHTDSQERVCSLLERAPASAGQPVSINSSSLPEGGGGLFRF